MKHFKNTVPFLFLLLLLLFLWQGSLAAEGVRQGLALCYRTVLPALFPAMVLCGMLSEVTEQLPFAPARTLWCTSLLCGYPLGLQAVARSYARGILEEKQALRLSACCSNASPVFLILYAGSEVLGSTASGVALLLAQTAVSFLLAWRLGALKKTALPPQPPCSVGRLFTAGLHSAVTSGMMLVGCVTFFSALAALFPALPYLHGILELTGGLEGNFFAVAALVGFSGCTVLLQNIACLTEAGLSPLPYLMGRAVYLFGVPIFGILLQNLTNGEIRVII